VELILRITLLLAIIFLMVSIYDIRCKDLLDDEEIHFGVIELRND